MHVDVEVIDIQKEKQYFEEYKYDIPVGVIGDKEIFRHTIGVQQYVDAIVDIHVENGGTV